MADTNSIRRPAEETPAADGMFVVFDDAPAPGSARAQQWPWNRDVEPGLVDAWLRVILRDHQW